VEAVGAHRPRAKLRVGVFADRATQPRWVANAFARVACSECAEIAVVAHGDNVPAQMPWLWRAYEALDASVFGSDADPSQELELAAQVPHGRTLPLPKRDRAADAAWRAEIARLDLDVAFALGDVDEDALCDLARFGVWRFSFGEPPSAKSAAPGFREVVEGEALTSSGLTIRLGNGEGMRAALQSWSRTYAYSAARNRDLLLHKTAAFALRALRELHRSGASWLRRCARIPQSPGEGTGDAPPLRRGVQAQEGDQGAHRDVQFPIFRLGHGDAVAVEIHGLLTQRRQCAASLTLVFRHACPPVYWCHYGTAPAWVSTGAIMASVGTLSRSLWHLSARRAPCTAS